MSTSYNTSKQTFASETPGTPVISTKQNPLYETVEALQDTVGYAGDLAADIGSHQSRLAQLFGIGSHSRQSVAAAATLTLPKTRVSVVTGTTTVTSLVTTGNDTGRLVVLEVTGSCEISDGNNINLEGVDFIGPGRLVLLCDGINWNELARNPGTGGGHTIIVSGNTMPDQPNLGFSTAFTGNNNNGTNTTEVAPNFGTTAGTIVQGNDARLSDARTPTAHAASHITGGSDVISVFGVGQRGLVPGPTVASGSKVLADNGNWILPSEAGLPTIFDQNGNPLTTRSQIKVVGEMANAADNGDDSTLLHFRFGKYSATTITATGTIVNLPTDGNIIQVNGNTTITNIPGPLTGYENRLVILYFTGEPTVQDGVGNISLDGGDFEANSGSMLGLWHNGSVWNEAFRSGVTGGGGGGGGLTNPVDYVDFTVAAAPSNPASGVTRVYALDPTGFMQQRDAGGTTLPLVGGTSGGIYLPVVTPYTIPTIAGTTEVGTGATWTDENDGITLVTPAEGNVVHARVAAPPAGGHWRLRIGIVPIHFTNADYHNLGICTYQTTDGKLQNFGVWRESVFQLRRANWNSNTSLNASTAVENPFYRHYPVMFFEVEQEDGVNRWYRFSVNGLKFEEWVATGSGSDFLGVPSHAGFFGCAAGGGEIEISCIHFEFEDLS